MRETDLDDEARKCIWKGEETCRSRMHLFFAGSVLGFVIIIRNYGFGPDREPGGAGSDITLKEERCCSRSYSLVSGKEVNPSIIQTELNDIRVVVGP